MDGCPDSAKKNLKICNLFETGIRTFACGLCSPNRKNTSSLTSNFGVRMNADICSFSYGCQRPFPITQTAQIFGCQNNVSKIKGKILMSKTLIASKPNIVWEIYFANASYWAMSLVDKKINSQIWRYHCLLLLTTLFCSSLVDLCFGFSSPIPTNI